MIPCGLDHTGALATPVETARQTAEFASSLGRVLAEPASKPSELLRGRSLTWRFLALDVAFSDLRAASKIAGASINDAFSYGYRVIVPHDCCGDMDQGPHDDNLRDVGRRYADVMDADDVMKHLANMKTNLKENLAAE